jgi:hypothetical protein
MEYSKWSRGSLQLVGSVWAPFAAINIGSGTGSTLIKGALWSGTQVNIQSSVNIEFSPFGGLNDDDTLIVPGYEPPSNSKSSDLIGPELSSLCQNSGSGIIPSPYIYNIIDQSILIEVVAIVGHYQDALNKLSTEYGMNSFIDNGLNSLLITGKIPIDKLCTMNNDALLKTYINAVRPLFPPITSGSGVASTSGDTSVHTNYVRDGYNLSGAGIKVGIISDGFNTIPGDPASIDVLNGDLTPVHVLKEYPYGRTLDEGRAMLQVVHDMAPAASLAFRTGFISEGDFAKGIYELQEDGCQVIADDITYITAPFFKDGLAAKAVDAVKSKGVSYFSAAGNFGAKSYEAIFNPAPAPLGVTGFAHNFGGGDILQDDSLKPGPYTIVMQWEDSIYSLGQGGALSDYDIYLTNDDGTIRFGMNRFNIGADPIEVLPFTVKGDTRTNIMIVRASGSGNVRFKIVVFRGDLKFNEFETGTSTLVGQANAVGAMAIAAARYTKTPAFGASPAVAESFTSIGGTPVYGTARKKPDFTAPDGVNTTVDFSSLNIEGDLFPNFFGTSAAAPHAAAAAALILEGKNKFYNKALEPDSVRLILSQTALDMSTTGFDYSTGYGLVQADAALASFARATPKIDTLIKDPSVIPGKETFNLTVKGNYFNASSVVTLNGVPEPTTIISPTQISATIPPFIGNPQVQVYSAPITSTALDGGYSSPLYFFSTIKKNVVVTADNKTKKFGEQLPQFSSTILVNNVPLAQTGLTLADLMLDGITCNTPAISQSNVGVYFIRPAMKPLSSSDSAIFELYNFTFNDGLLSNTKMPLLITPKDTTLTYGDKISGFNFIYSYDNTLIPVAQRAGFLANIGVVHNATLNNNVVALVDAKSILNGRVLTDADLVTMGVMASAKSILNARSILNAKTILNGILIEDTTRIVDIAVQSIYNYQLDSSSSPLVSAKTILNAKAILNAKSILNGTAEVNAKTILNGSTILNNNSVGDSSNKNIVVIIDEDDVTAETNTVFDFKSINLITGTTAGKFTIVPAAFISDNFEIRYGLGKLTINPVPLIVKADSKVIRQGDTLPKFTAVITGLKNRDTLQSALSYKLNPLYSGNAGTYSIIPFGISVETPESYVVTYTPGTLYVNPFGNNAKNVKPSLVCVDTLKNDPSGFRYLAKFEYTNSNATVVFVERGADNFLQGNYAGTQPEIFPPGTGSFNIAFDGLKLKWTLNTFYGTQKTSTAAEASSTSSRCKKSQTNAAVTIEVIPVEKSTDKVFVFPNPTRDVVTITSEQGVIYEKDLTVTDMTGKIYTPRRITRIAANSLSLDLTKNIAAGVYIIKAKVDNSYKLFRVVKW